MSSNTTYYYRIAASSSAGTSYGSETSFTTPSSSSTSTFVIQPGSEGKDTCYGTVYATNGTPDAETLYMGGWGDAYYDFFELDLSVSPSANDTVSVTLSVRGRSP